MRIVLFDLDCLRPDHLGCYGYERPTSPRIDSVAREGIRFSSYYCADSPCLPSRAGWATGRFGIHNGIVTNHGPGSRLRIRCRSYVGPEPENEMFPRLLRRHGIDTFSFSNFADRHNAWWFTCGWTGFHTPNLKGGEETAEEVNEPVLRWIRRNGRRDDYLLHINYWDIHRCYNVDPSWAERFRDHPVPQSWPDEAAIERHQSIRGPFTALSQFPGHRSSVPLMPGAVRSRADFERLVTGYDAAIAYADHHLGLVLDELDRQGVLDDTAVVITADHGDAFGEHGIYSDHVCADECIHRIPLIIRWPDRAPAGAESDVPATQVDLPATICDLLGIPIPGEWDGVSFAANVAGEPRGGRDFLVWGHALYAVQRAVRTRDHLMIRTYDPLDYGFEEYQLFDMGADPCQTENLAFKRPDLVADHVEKLEMWIRSQLEREGAGPDPFREVLEARGIHPSFP